MRKILSIMALFVISLLTVSMVSAEATTLGNLDDATYGNVLVKVNDEELDNTLLTVDKGEELEIEVELSIINNLDSTDDSAKNIEVEARLMGYDEEDVEDSVLVKKVAEGTEKNVKLKLTVPEDFPNGNATLRVLVTGGLEQVYTDYQLNIESPSHSVKIADVSFSPSLTVKAGRSLLTTVLLENVGENKEEDVKVTVAVPELGISVSEYVDEVLKDEHEDVDEMFLQIPADAEAGEYTVKVTAQYDDLDESVTETYTLKVLENDLVKPQTKAGKLVLAVGPERQSVTAGDSKAVSYAVALTNEGSASKAYLLEVATGDWATATLSESLVVLEPGQNKVVYVDLTANADAAVGEHLASLTVKSGSDVLESVVLKTTVVQGTSANKESANLRNGLEIALVVLVVLLVLVGLVIGFSRLRKDNDGEEKYY
mgnify:CR=1 FL=1